MRRQVRQGSGVGGINRGPITKDFAHHAEEIGFYPEGDGKPMKNFKQGRDMIKFAF